MKFQRLAILLASMCLVVGLEGMMLRTFTSSEESAAIPTASPEPSDAAPEATFGTQTQIPTPAPTMPGFTSPPVGGGGGGTGTTTTNSNNSGGGNNNSSGGGSTSPTQAPAPTNPPPPTQAPASVTGSGSFSSDTGAGVNMSVSWQAVDLGNGTTRLKITGTVSSWSLQVMSQPISISFSGYSKSLMGSSINYTGNGPSVNNLFSTELDVASGTSGTMSVVWSYNGTYGTGENQVSLPTITASDYVYTN